MSQYAMRKVNIPAPFGCQNQTDPLPANSIRGFKTGHCPKDRVDRPKRKRRPAEYNRRAALVRRGRVLKSRQTRLAIHVPPPYDPNWDSLRDGTGLGSFCLGRHSHTEVNGDGKIANPHQKRAVPPTAHPCKAASAPPVPELGPLLWVLAPLAMRHSKRGTGLFDPQWPHMKT
jgi:hypothetical protein